MAQAGTGAGPLWERRRAETSQPVRSSLALALGMIDPAAAGPVLAEAVLPAARAQLTGAAAATYPRREAQILAARVVAAFDGIQPVLATVRAVLTGGDTPARSAADLVADLTPANRGALSGLEPLLRERLGDYRSRLAAARALARLGMPVADLTEPLIHGVTDYACRYGLDTILELRAVDTIPGLEALTTGDQRLPATGSHHDIVWADELLIDRIHATVAHLRAG